MTRHLNATQLGNIAPLRGSRAHDSARGEVHHELGITLAGVGAGREGAVERGEFVGTECYSQNFEIARQPRAPANAQKRHDVVASREQPRDR